MGAPWALGREHTSNHTDFRITSLIVHSILGVTHFVKPNEINKVLTIFLRVQCSTHNASETIQVRHIRAELEYFSSFIVYLENSGDFAILCHTILRLIYM